MKGAAICGPRVAARAARVMTTIAMLVLALAATGSRAADPRIVNLAATLGNDPAQIFAYVRDSVGIDLYGGSLRGARGTLASHAGNALDRAALAVELLRAAGFSARYAQGTLSDSNAQRVIARSYPAPQRILGCYNPGAIADPVNDFQQISLAKAHSWVEYKPTSAAPWTTFDPTFAGAVIGTANTAATQTFDEIPDAQLHKLRFRVTAETYSQAGAIYGFGISSSVVLDRTYTAAELVDRPVTFGQFVSQSSLPGLAITASTNTYSPYLMLGDSTLDPRNYDVVRGTDYSETLTNFPLGSTVLTGVFVDIDVIDPASPANPQSARRVLVDRIGYAARQAGGVVNYGVSPTDGPALTPLDLLTVQVAPSKQPLDDFAARRTRLVALQAESAGIAAAVAALPTPDLMTPGDVALTQRAVALNRATEIAQLELATATYEGAAGVAMERNASLYLVRPTIASPRLTVARASFANNSLALTLDIRRNPLSVYPLPGISFVNAQHYEQARGLTESTLEGTVLTQLTGQPSTTIASLLASKRDPAAYIPLTAANLADVDNLTLSNDAKARIRDTLSASRIVLAPRTPFIVDGKPVGAWIESDPATGYSISTFEDGTHGALVEYTALYFNRFGEQNLENTMAKYIGNFSSLSLVSLAYMSGLLTAIADDAEFSDSFAETKEILQQITKSVLTPITEYLKYTTLELEIKGGAGTVYALFTGLLEGIDAFDKALELMLGDPPVPPILMSPPLPPLPAAVAPGAVAGVSVALTQDARFVVPYNGAEFSSVYLASVTNTGPATDTFRLSPQGSDYPFSNFAPAPALTLAPGATGEVSVCLVPYATVGNPGAPIGFGVVDTSTTDPTVHVAASGGFATPQATSLLMRILPGGANVTAGASTTATLTLDSLGNTATTVALSASSTPGLTLGGLPASVALAAGESKSLPLTFNVAAGTAAGTSLGTFITGDFGGTAPATDAFVVTVTTADTQCTIDAGLASGALGRSGMSVMLVVLADAMDDLRATPADPARRNVVLAALDNLVTQFDAPYLQSYVATIGALRTSLAAADSSGVAAILTAIDSALCGLRQTLRTSSQGDFTVNLLPTTAINIPTQSTSVAINVSNKIAVPRVFDITLSGVPANVTATLTTPTITVPASYQTNGCCGSPALTVTFNDTDGVARAFDYTVTATPRDNPDGGRMAFGHLVLRPDLLRVVQVSATPAYGPAGTTFSVQAHAMNSLNAARSIYAGWTVLDHAGVLRAQGSTAAVAVASGDGLFDLPAFNVPSAALADGVYTVDVTLYDATACCDAISGSAGQTAFIVGVPFSANLSIAPQDLPPGDSDVALTLALSHDSLPTPSIVVRDALALPAAARSIAQSGNYLYVCQEDRVMVFDATDPKAPSAVATFATGVLSSGYGTVACNINGNSLVLAYSGDTPTSFDTIKIVVFDIGGANATAPVQQNPTPVDLGKLFGGSILFDGTTGYLPTTVYSYNPYSRFIFQQNGNLLDIDFSTPTAPLLNGELFHHFPPPSTDTNDPVEGGPNMIFGVAQSGSLLYLPSTTSTGGGVDSGVGRLDVVDTSSLATNCPGAPNPCIVRTLDVAEARLLFGIARQGNTLVTVGDTAGYYDGLSGLTGNLTVSAFDVSDPANPVLRSTLVTPLRNSRAQNMCNENGDAGGSGLTALDNQFYAVGAFNPSTCSWVMTLVDASDPDNLRVIPYDVTDVLATTLLRGDTLYAVTRTGVLVYDYAILTGPAIAVRVDMAKGNGVTVLPGSFSLAPTSVDTSASDHDSYTWLQPSSATIAWTAHVAGMQPGETRTVAQGGSVDFTLPSIGAGVLPINGVSVVSDQSMSIAPAKQDAGIAQAVDYTITLGNPTDAPVTYALSVGGVDPAWITALPATVTVAAHAGASATLTLQSSLGDFGGNYPFTVTATTSGFATSAQASIFLDPFYRFTGSDLNANFAATTVTASPAPVTAGRGDTARVTLHTYNGGSATQLYDYVQAVTPSGWNVTFENNNVPASVNASVDIVAAITTATNTVPGNYQVGVDLYANNGYVGRTTLDVTVSPAGVRVAIVPSSGTPATPFAVTVTNTGTDADTFDLSALGALGPVVSFDSNPVALAAGASQTMTATLGNTAYLPVGGATFDVVAQSRADGAAHDRATAQVQLAAAKGVALDGIPDAITLPGVPSAASFAVQLSNAGNVDDAYTLSVAGTSGNVSASLRDTASLPTQTIALALPGHALAQFALDATLTSGTAGTVTLQAASQTDSSVHASVTLSLAVGAVANVSASPDPLAFGDQLVGTASAASTAVLTNSGNAAFAISTLALDGTNAGDFALGSGANACVAGGSIAANGGTCTLYLTFAPSGTGARSASVTASDTASGASATLQLTGNGMAANTCVSGAVPGGTATACFTGGGASCQYAHAAFIPLTGDAASPPSGSAPAGFTFPFGLFDFATSGCTTAGSLTFTIDYPGALPARTVYYKYSSPDGTAPAQWHTIPASVSGHRVTFSLAAGNIVDPGGPAIPDAGPPPPAATAIAVPTLGERGLALLMMLLVATGFAARRRKG